jgi:hypothetical protein
MVGLGEVDSNEWTAIQQVAGRLAESFPDLSPDKVTEVVHHVHARFDGRPVRDFVPLFVERGARRELGSAT